LGEGGTTEMSLEMALFVAADAHRKQFDKLGVKYIFHPMRLAVMAQALGLDEESQEVALLHDVVEDTDTTLDDLRDCGFSERVIAGVDAMTRRNGKNAVKYNGIPVDETYMDFLRRSSLDGIARKIKPLDNADNMRPERSLSGDFKLPVRYRRAYRYLMNANVVAGDLDYVIRFRRLHPWVHQYV